MRGYRENSFVRDSGLVAGVEARIPVDTRVEPRLRVDLVPFVDLGHSWNSDGPEIGEQTPISVGIGTRVFLTHRARFELFWADALRPPPNAGERDIQDEGIHFRLSVEWP